MNQLINTWKNFNTYFLKRYPLAWMANIHVTLLLMPLLFLIYTVYFKSCKPYENISVRSVPIYFNVLIDILILYLCVLKRKQLISWHHFNRHILYLFLNIILLSLTLFLASFSLNTDPLKLKSEKKRYAVINNLSSWSKIMDPNRYFMESSAKILYAMGLLNSLEEDSVYKNLMPAEIRRAQQLFTILDIDTAAMAAKGSPVYLIYREQTYVDTAMVQPVEENGKHIGTFSIYYYINNELEQRAQFYLKGIELTPWHFLLISLFILSNMTFFFLAVQVLNKREWKRNLSFFTTLTLALLLFISLSNKNTTFKELGVLYISIFTLICLAVNFMFHGKRKFFEGIQKLLFLLHIIFFIAMIIIASDTTLEPIFTIMELILFVITFSITYFVFQRYYQPQKIVN